MSKQRKTPEREQVKRKKTERPTWVTPRRERNVGMPTVEMLRAAAAAHLADQHVTLWGQSFDLINDDPALAADWLAQQVVEVLGELST